MRPPRSRISQRRRARGARREPILRLQILAHWVRQAAERVQRRSHLWPTLPIVLLVLGIGVLLGGAAPGAQAVAASNGAAAHGLGHQRASAQRSSARWIDPSDRTTFILTLQESRSKIPGAFTFVLPNGDEIRALKVTSPLIGLAVKLAQVSPEAPFDAQAPFCSEATLVPASPQAPSAEQFVVAALVLHIGQGGLLAYAGLSYALPSDVSFNVCQLPPQYEMKAGCVDMTSCSPLPTPAQALGQYDQAVVAAAQSGDWSTVYTLTGQVVTAQYSASAFAATMNQQVQRVGRITAITPISGSYVIQFDAAGQAYFVAKALVTLDHNGTTSAKPITTYYLLEDESGTATPNWQLWFSCAPDQPNC
jgi:hypothetical protein